MIKLEFKTDFRPDKLESSFDDAVARGLVAGGREMVRALKDEAPVETGALRDSIEADPPDGRRVVVHAGRDLDDRRAAATQARENWGGKAVFRAQGRIRRAFVRALRRAFRRR